jgi:transketolase
MSTEQLAADAIRVLAMDAVQRANSGHPGMPMGMADIATVLWHDFILVDPEQPMWPDRDRFVVSNGHGSMLLYGLLHLSGFDLSMDDIRNFRQLGSPTPGHPELDLGRGIETTTGPLGQGFATAVGMAIAEEHLRAVIGSELVDHATYVFCGDGDLMEGLTAEAASLAGHMALGKLLVVFDDNSISLEGPTSWTISEDVTARFDAYGWHTATIDGHDRSAVRRAIADAKADVERPSLIAAKTHIGYGSPNKQDTASAHGSPLGGDEVALVRERLAWTSPPFEIPEDVYSYFRSAMERGRTARRRWEERLATAPADQAEAWRAHMDPAPVRIDVPRHDPGAEVATRSLSGEVIQQIAAQRPGFLTGDADLAGSTKSLIEGEDDFSAKDRVSRNVRYGVREHAMGAAVNGIVLHGGSRAFGSTFLTFSDYMRPAVRLSALMEIPSIWVWSHDSVFLGEDGPTHQPVEHLAALRAIPGLHVMRPADPAETAACWEAAMERDDGPSAIVLTRQNLPVPAVAASGDQVKRGGYVRRAGGAATVIATGSEVWLAEAAADLLAQKGLELRVVSMPCVERFLEQPDDYRTEVLGGGPRISLEAAVSFGWRRIIGADGLAIAIDRFGESAPWRDLAAHFGFTPAAVADRIEGWLAG